MKKYTQEQKTESLRASLIKAGYDMAFTQVEGMLDDIETWEQYIIDGKINPKCIDISEQAAHSFYNNELDIWFDPNEDFFPEPYGNGGLNELIENQGITDDEVFELLNKGVENYIIEIYGKDWQLKYPDPNF